MPKMSKSDQTERSLGELAPEVIASAAAAEARYLVLREELRKKYGTGSPDNENKCL